LNSTKKQKQKPDLERYMNYLPLVLAFLYDIKLLLRLYYHILTSK